MSKRHERRPTAQPNGRGKRYEVRPERVLDLEALPRIRNERHYWRVYDRDGDEYVGDRYSEQATAERKAKLLNKAEK